MACHYSQKTSLENRVGLHYSRFWPFCSSALLENQLLTPLKNLPTRRIREVGLASVHKTFGSVTCARNWELLIASGVGAAAKADAGLVPLCPLASLGYENTHDYFSFFMVRVLRKLTESAKSELASA
jgi:hypothetical protein